jgi:S1-C subfamily serine protease
VNPERLLILLALTGSCMASPRMPEPPTPQALAAATLNAVVKIATPQGHGSGFFVNGYTVATAQHVITAVMTGGTPPTITTHDGQTCAPEGAWLDDDHDLAFVRVSGCTAPNVLYVAHDPEQGAEVLAAGHPMMTDWAVVAGVISRVSVPAMGGEMQITAQVQMGMSGGPVVDDRGHLVGLVVGLQSPDGWWAGMGWALPAGVITAGLTEYNLSLGADQTPAG